MNRTIKFRAWDKLDSEMRPCTGLHFWYGQELSTVSVDGSEDELQDLSAKRFEIMQFTGLLDKNGKEIYEGDIVKAYFPSTEVSPTEIIAAVTFIEGSFNVSHLNREPVTLREIIKISNQGSANFNGVEVIGNVYEDPTLLTN